METIGDRVKQIRKSERIHLTLEKFGEKIGMGKSAVSDIENGRQNVTPQTKISICREFNVNREWLETGEGEMFLKMDVEEEIAELIKKIPNEPRGSFKRRLLATLAGLTEDQWVLLADIAEKLAEEKEDDE